MSDIILQWSDTNWPLCSFVTTTPHDDDDGHIFSLLKLTCAVT